MKLLKISAAAIASASLLLTSATVAEAYPMDAATQIILSKTSAIRSGATIKVKAKNVDKGCEVTFTIEGRVAEDEDYDISSAFSGNNYSTAYTAIQVPETPGEYKVIADYEPSCRVSGTHGNKTAASFQVGKVTTLSTPTATSTALLLSKKPTLAFTGSLTSRSTLSGSASALGGQKVSVVVSITPAAGGAVSKLPAIVVTTDASGNYKGAVKLSTKNLKGSYTIAATYAGDKVYSPAVSSSSTSLSIASVRAKAAAAKLAAAIVGPRGLSANKLVL